MKRRNNHADCCVWEQIRALLNLRVNLLNPLTLALSRR